MAVKLSRPYLKPISNSKNFYGPIPKKKEKKMLTMFALTGKRFIRNGSVNVQRKYSHFVRRRCK